MRLYGLVVVVVVVVACAGACGRMDFDPLASAPRDGATADAATVDGPPAAIAFEQVTGLGVAAVAVDTFSLAPVHVGDAILVGIDYDGQVSATHVITDSLGNSYQIVESVLDSGTFTSILAYTVTTTAGADTVTITLDNASNDYFDADAWVYSGLVATDPFIVGSQGSGLAAGPDSATSPALTTTAPRSLLFAFIPCGCVSSSGTGFALRQDPTDDAGEDAIVGPGAHTMVGTTDNSGYSWEMLSAAFTGM